MDGSKGPWMSVDSYQVPVPKGDCLIHLLVERYAKDAPGISDKRPKVEIAILVDGGKPAQEAGDTIKATVNAIRSKYCEFPDFKYWLVTHWDDDHYAGAVKYLNEAGQNPAVYGPVSWTEKELGIKNPGEEVMTFFKYKSDKDHVNNHSYHIGEDFFAESLTLYNEIPPKVTFLDWLGRNGPGARPIFLCVAANGYCIDKKDAVQRNITERNDTSAFFVIAWPGAKAICYYAAGDGNSEIEKYFVNQKFLSFKEELGTRVAKGTHHGAIAEFSEKLFYQMKPETYVVSVGQEYGHPTAALLVQLALYKQNHKFKLYTSRFPYYLYDTKELSQTDLSISHIQKTFDSMSHISIDFAPLTALKTLVSDYDKEDKNEGNKDKKEEAAGYLKQIWEYLSDSKVPNSAHQETPYLVYMGYLQPIAGKAFVRVIATASEYPLP